MTRALALALFSLVALARVASAQTPTPATFYPLPQNNASFFTTLYNYLYGEDAARDSTWSSNYTLAPDRCIHPTAAGTTGTFSKTCLAMVDGNYTVDPTASINYATAFGATSTDFCWVILTSDTTTAITGFTRLTGTHYMGNCTASGSSRPALNTDAAMYVMGVTLTGGAITSVLTAAPSTSTLWRYTNASELLTNDIAGRLYLPDFGTFCISDAGGTCSPIATGDGPAGCAVCGDSASGFFATGALESAYGGTGEDTSALTNGVPQLGPTPGRWTFPTAVAVARGGTGKDLSAVSGSALVMKTPGVVTSQFFPTSLLRQPASVIGVDGTECVKDDTNMTFATNVIGSAFTCTDSSSARFGGVVSLPSSYDPNTSVNVIIQSVNTSSDVGVMGFDFTCLCVGDGETVTASNFASNVNLDTTYSGTPGENEISNVTITCGGTCQPEDDLYYRATIDTAATTMPTPALVKFGELSLEVQNTELSN